MTNHINHCVNDPLNAPLTDQGKRLPKKLWAVLLSLLVLGAGFRLANLDHKLYWSDEAGTSLRISGYTSAEAQANLFGNAQSFSVADLAKYQYPNSDKSWLDTIRCLALEDPQNGPLYFILTRWWLQVWGNSVTATRSFGAVLSLLAFPCLYWLCQELFKSPMVGWWAMAIAAVSPIHLIYAQEARPYSLWVMTILLSSIALLRALRRNTKRSWLWYALTISCGLYTHLVFGLVAIGQACYLVATARGRGMQGVIRGGLALLAGLLTFVPWLEVIRRSPADMETAQMSWIDTKQSLGETAMRWAALVSRTFVDLGVAPNDGWASKIAVLPLILLVILLSVYAVYFLWRHAPQRVSWFVLTLIGSVGLPLFLLDFGLGKRYGTTRYLLPATIGVQLCLAYLLAMALTAVTMRARRRWLYQGLAAVVMALGIGSCALNVRAEMWWNKFPIAYGDYPQEIRLINQADRPLLLTNNLREMMMLSHQLDPKVRVQFLNDDDRPQIADGFSDVFLHSDSVVLRQNLAQQYPSDFKPIAKSLWKLR
jgi:uncharacterized membrane protein